MPSPSNNWLTQEVWLQEALSAEPIKPQDASGFQPKDLVPIIALGHVGGRILESLAAFWEAKGLSSQELPFLWVDVVLPSEEQDQIERMVDLPDRNKVLLIPRWHELTYTFRFDPSLHALFPWFSYSKDLPPKLAGRAAFYWEIMKGPNSHLRHFLQTFGQHDKLLRIVVAAWEEPVTGFLIDLVAAYHHFRDQSEQTRRVEIWLLGPLEEPFEEARRSFSPAKMQRASVALLWEVARFQWARSTPFTFTFSPPRTLYQRDQDVQIAHGLFERIFYFEGKAGRQHLEHGLRLLVGKNQAEYQKRLRNYHKDWPTPVASPSEPIQEHFPYEASALREDGVLCSFGAHFHTHNLHNAERLLILLLLHGLLFGPLGLYPLPSEKLFLPMDFPFRPQAQNDRVRELLQQLKALLTQQALDARLYHLIGRLLRNYLNTLQGLPHVQVHPFEEARIALQRLLAARDLTLNFRQRENLERLLSVFEERARELQRLHTILKERWERAWEQLPQKQRRDLQHLYHEFFAPLEHPNELKRTLWFRVRKRVQWALQPQVMAGRAYWGLDYVLLPEDLTPSLERRWASDYVSDDTERVISHWRQLLYHLPPVHTARQASYLPEVFHREVRKNFAKFLPTLKSVVPPHLYVPQFHHLALVTTPYEPEAQRLERYLKDEAPERFSEVILSTEPALGGYGLLLHKEPYPMQYMELFRQSPFEFSPSEFAHRGEQFLAWLRNFPVPQITLSPQFRTWLEYHEPWLLPWTQAWVLFATPPQLAELSDDDFYQEMEDLLHHAWSRLFQKHLPPNETWPSPEQPLPAPQHFARFHIYWVWWEHVRQNPPEALPDTRHLEELLADWRDEIPESMQQRAQYLLESAFSDERRWQRGFRRLSPQQQEALLWLYIVAHMMSH